MTGDIYLDHASATPLRPEAREAFLAALDLFGDPLQHPRARPRGAPADRRRARDRVGGDRGPARRARLHLGRHGVGGARDLGRRPRAARARHPDRRGRRRTPRRGRRLPRARERRIRGRPRAGRRARPDRPRRLRARGPRARARSSRACSTRTTSSARCSRSRRPPGSRREAKVRFHTDACQTVGRLPVERRGARRRPAVALRAQVRRTAGRRRAVRATRGRHHGLPVRRRPGAQAPLGDGEHAGDRRDGGRAVGLAGRDGRRRGGPMGAHRTAPRPASRPPSRAPGSTATRPTARPTSCASASTDLDPATLMMALDDRGFRVAAGSICSGRPEDALAGARADRATRQRELPRGLGTRHRPRSEVDALLDVLPDVVSELREVERASARRRWRASARRPS